MCRLWKCPPCYTMLHHCLYWAVKLPGIHFLKKKNTWHRSKGKTWTLHSMWTWHHINAVLPNSSASAWLCSRCTTNHHGHLANLINTTGLHLHSKSLRAQEEMGKLWPCVFQQGVTDVGPSSLRKTEIFTIICCGPSDTINNTSTDPNFW